MLIWREDRLLFTVGAVLIVLLVATQTGCDGHSGKPGTASMPLTGSSFSGAIPNRYACSRQNCPCDGQDISPELSWNSPPEHTRSFTLGVTDKDSFFGMGRLFGYFAHWVLYDIPAEKRELREGVGKERQFPDGSRQGVNRLHWTVPVGSLASSLPVYSICARHHAESARRGFAQAGAKATPRRARLSLARIRPSS